MAIHRLPIFRPPISSDDYPYQKTIERFPDLGLRICGQNWLIILLHVQADYS